MRKITTIVGAYVKAGQVAKDMRRALWSDLRGQDAEAVADFKASIAEGIRERGESPKRFHEDFRIATTMGPIVDEAGDEDPRAFTPQMVSAVNACGGGVEGYEAVLASDESLEDIAKAAKPAETPLQRAKRLAADLAKVMPELTKKQQAAIISGLSA